MEGCFNDVFIETGIEYYKNGNIRFMANTTKSPEPTMARAISYSADYTMNPGRCGMRVSSL